VLAARLQAAGGFVIVDVGARHRLDERLGTQNPSHVVHDRRVPPDRARLVGRVHAHMLQGTSGRRP